MTTYNNVKPLVWTVKTANRTPHNRGEKTDVTTHDWLVLIHFLNLQVMSLVTWGNGNGSSDSSSTVSSSLSSRAVNFLSAQSNKVILTQVQLWSNLNGLSESLMDSSHNANPAAYQAEWETHLC